MLKKVFVKTCIQVVRICFVLVFSAISLAGITFVGLMGYNLIF
ncbi:MAG TPA: hypothetical protein VFF14_00845 [Candidatus Deferrimicrobium sp.]|nr:hypothetical protein [Candidatus Deferrimicrobium sp.]